MIFETASSPPLSIRGELSGWTHDRMGVKCAARGSILNGGGNTWVTRGIRPGARVPNAKSSVQPRAKVSEEVFLGQKIVPLPAHGEPEVARALSRALRRLLPHSRRSAARLAHICHEWR